MSFRDDLLPDLDTIRAIPGELGLRTTRVFVVVKTWSGPRPGIGNPSNETETEILTGGQPPNVRRMSGKEIVALGHLMQDELYAVSPITPEFVGGGTPADTLSPPVPASKVPTTITYRLQGPMGSISCTKLSERLDKSFRYSLILQTTGKVPPSP